MFYTLLISYLIKHQIWSSLKMKMKKKVNFKKKTLQALKEGLREVVPKENLRDIDFYFSLKVVF